MAILTGSSQLKRGTAAAWTLANPILLAGQEGYETDTGKRKVGDGVTEWNSLSYHEKLTTAEKANLALQSGFTAGYVPVAIDNKTLGNSLLRDNGSLLSYNMPPSTDTVFTRKTIGDSASDFADKIFKSNGTTLMYSLNAEGDLMTLGYINLKDSKGILFNTGSTLIDNGGNIELHGDSNVALTGNTVSISSPGSSQYTSYQEITIVAEALFISSAKNFNINAGVNYPSVNMYSGTSTWNAGAISSQYDVYIRKPTFEASGASVMANGATFVIEGPPTAGTNMTITTPLALWVLSGNVKFGGDIVGGVWKGTKVSEAYGGTNQQAYTTGDMLYASATNTLSKLAAGTNGQVLTLAAGVPTWADAPGGGLSGLTAGFVPVASSSTTIVNSGVKADARSLTIRPAVPIVIGASGGDYPYIGYNFVTGGTTGEYTRLVADVSTAFQVGDSFIFKTGSSGSVGSAITWTDQMTVGANITIRSLASGTERFVFASSSGVLLYRNWVDFKIQVGSGGGDSADSFVNIGRVINASSLSNGHGYTDGTIFTKTNNNYAYNSYDALPVYGGTADYDHYAGFQERMLYQSTGTITDHFAFFSLPNYSSGIIINRYGLCYADWTQAGTAVNTNQYAVFVDSLVNATNNWALYSVNAKSYSGGDIIIGDSAKGIVLKDTQGTPHFWRITISNVGVLTTTDLGTSMP